MAIYQGDQLVGNNYVINLNQIEDDNISDSTTWSSEKINTEKLSTSDIATLNNRSITLYIDNTNGSDTNDGLTAAAPLKTIDMDKIQKKFGYPYSVTFNLLSDYDCKGTSIFLRNTKGVTIRTAPSVSATCAIYSTVEMTSPIIDCADATSLTLNKISLENRSDWSILSSSAALLSITVTNLYLNNTIIKSTNDSDLFLINTSRVNCFMNNSSIQSPPDGNSEIQLLTGNNTNFCLNNSAMITNGILSNAMGNTFFLGVGSSLSYTTAGKNESCRPIVFNTFEKQSPNYSGVTLIAQNTKNEVITGTYTATEDCYLNITVVGTQTTVTETTDARLSVGSLIICSVDSVITNVGRGNSVRVKAGTKVDYRLKSNALQTINLYKVPLY